MFSKLPVEWQIEEENLQLHICKQFLWHSPSPLLVDFSLHTFSCPPLVPPPTTPLVVLSMSLLPPHLWLSSPCPSSLLTFGCPLHVPSPCTPLVVLLLSLLPPHLDSFYWGEVKALRCSGTKGSESRNEVAVLIFKSLSWCPPAYHMVPPSCYLWLILLLWLWRRRRVMSRLLGPHMRQEDSRYFRTSSLNLLSFPFPRPTPASQQVPESIYSVHGCKGRSFYHPDLWVLGRTADTICINPAFYGLGGLRCWSRLVSGKSTTVGRLEASYRPFFTTLYHIVTHSVVTA